MHCSSLLPYAIVRQTKRTRGAPLGSLVIWPSCQTRFKPRRHIERHTKIDGSTTTCNLISAAPVSVSGSLLSAVYLLYPYLTPVDDGDSDLPNNVVDTASRPARQAPVWPPKASCLP